MPKARATKTHSLIAEAYAILEAQHPTSVRGVAYQLFARGIIPSMAVKETQRVSVHLKAARLCGDIPWEWITDGTRPLEGDNVWHGLADFGEDVRLGYRKDYWQLQSVHLEVWCEKSTIRGVIAPVLNAYGVKFQFHKGFSSVTAVHDAAARSTQWADEKEDIILYLGDYDPSGMRMSEKQLPRDLARHDGRQTLRRIALTSEDVTTSAIPSFEAITKRKDSNYRWFVTNYGQCCWELDAMNPNELRDRVEHAIQEYIEPVAWERCLATERAEQASLAEIVTRFRAAQR